MTDSNGKPFADTVLPCLNILTITRSDVPFEIELKLPDFTAYPDMDSEALEVNQFLDLLGSIVRRVLNEEAKHEPR